MTDTIMTAAALTPATPHGSTALYGQWRRALFLIAVCVAAIVASQMWISDHRYAWIASTALIVAVLMVIGWAAADRADGVLVDKRNVVSFSKLQMTVWTVLICGAIATEVGRRLVSGAEIAPMGFTIPGSLLIAMGISTTSLVATPVLLSLKSTSPGGGGAAVDTVFRRDSKSDASWADVFTGDETGNADSVDLGKVQQFLITLLVVAVYVSLLWSAFGGPDKNTLPDFDQNLAWLLGISHAGYLSYKAAPHTNASDPKNPT